MTEESKEERPDAAPLDAAAESRRIEAYLIGEPEAVREIDSWIRAGIHSRYPVLRAEADDLCQAVHERLLSTLRLSRFRRRSSLRTYVTGILHHTAIDLIRKRWRDAPLEGRAEPAAPDNPYECLASLEQKQLFHLVLQRAPEPCRALWSMVFLERLPYAEIARRLDLPEGTVKSRMSQCRAKALLLLRRLGDRRNVRPFRPRSS